MMRFTVTLVLCTALLAASAWANDLPQPGFACSVAIVEVQNSSEISFVRVAETVAMEMESAIAKIPGVTIMPAAEVESALQRSVVNSGPSDLSVTDWAAMADLLGAGLLVSADVVDARYGPADRRGAVTIKVVAYESARRARTLSTMVTADALIGSLDVPRADQVRPAIAEAALEIAAFLKTNLEVHGPIMTARNLKRLAVELGASVGANTGDYIWLLKERQPVALARINRTFPHFSYACIVEMYPP